MVQENVSAIRVVKAYVREQHEKARKILQENVQKLHEIAKHLYENETITGEEFMEILNSSENSLLNSQPEA